jgi:hypothetical protein
MEVADRVLWSFFVIGILVAFKAWYSETQIHENFLNLGGNMEDAMGITTAQITTQALDAAPSTSEVKQHYKNLLIFCDADIRAQGWKGLRILADFRDRVYGPRDFRANLKVEDFLADWPDWLPPLDTTQREPVPALADAITAEVRMLAYLQKNWPVEPQVDEQTGATIRNMIEDFGYRFVFEKGKEVAQVRPDFLRVPLTRNWVNPVNRS